MTQTKSIDLAGRSLFVGLPTYDYKLHIGTVSGLLKLSQEVMALGVALRLGTVCGCSVISRARNVAVHDFLDTDATDLLFVDSDISFDGQDALRLMAAATDKDIVAGVYEARMPGKVYNVTLDLKDGAVLMDDNGLVRVQRVGTGFMLIRRHVLRRMQDEHPEWEYYDPIAKASMWSIFDFKSTREAYIGEDYLFCDRAREMGFEIWVDPSLKLGHMGNHEYISEFGKDALYPAMGNNRPMSIAA